MVLIYLQDCLRSLEQEKGLLSTYLVEGAQHVSTSLHLKVVGTPMVEEDQLHKTTTNIIEEVEHIIEQVGDGPLQLIASIL